MNESVSTINEALKNNPNILLHNRFSRKFVKRVNCCDNDYKLLSNYKRPPSPIKSIV